jgi:ammonium transporter, Amt family
MDLENITILKLIYDFTSLQISTSIMTQSLLERTHLDTYVALTIIYSAIGWPVAHSWIAGGGWLKQLGAVDFAGGGTVNVLASLIGIIGTLMIGPRLGVFDNKLNID